MKGIYNKFHVLNRFVAVLFLLVLPLAASYAAAGCCSNHGGVKGCAATGFQQCKDGSVSATCSCAKSKTTPSTTKSTKSNATSKSSTNSNIMGCCSGHGGVAQCNKSTGYQMCKDGKASTTCKCK
jgi:hypothetical protein